MKKDEKRSKSVQAIPDGFHTVTPYLIVEDATRFIDFIKKAFGGKATFISRGEGDVIMHATVTVGNSILMISDATEQMHPISCMLFLYVDDVDSVYKKAVEARGISMQEPKDEFYGDRAAAVRDEWGNHWWIATHIEDVSPGELEKRSKQVRQERKENEKMAHA